MAEKTLKPTAKRLRDARKRGEVARSADVSSALVFVGVVLALYAGGRYMLGEMSAAFRFALDTTALADPLPRLRQVVALLSHEWLVFGVALAALAALCGAAGAFFQVGGLMAWARLKPDMGHLNPAVGLRRMFSMRAMIDLALMLGKTLCLTAILFTLIHGSLNAAIESGFSSPAGILALATKLVLLLFGWAAVVYAAIAALDFAHQRAQYQKQMRMSLEELRREQKEEEGDPHIDARRRQMAREVLFSGMQDRVRVASVVVYSSTVAVALYYPGRGALPWVLARGEGEAAERLRLMAQEFLRPTLANAGLAQAIYDSTPVDQYIDRTLFEQVAGLLRWAKGV